MPKQYAITQTHHVKALR